MEIIIFERDGAVVIAFHDDTRETGAFTEGHGGEEGRVVFDVGSHYFFEKIGVELAQK